MKSQGRIRVGVAGSILAGLSHVTHAEDWTYHADAYFLAADVDIATARGQATAEFDDILDHLEFAFFASFAAKRNELVLIANGRPFGKARITLRLFDDDNNGCVIDMAEVPVTAPLSWLPQRVSLTAAFLRNRECTLRLASLAERRNPTRG